MIQRKYRPIFNEFEWIALHNHNENFEKLSSLVRKSKPEKEDLEESKKIMQYWIFDGIIDDKSLVFKERFNIIKKEVEKVVGEGNKSFKFVLNKEVISHDEFVKIVKEHHREKWFLGGSDGKI